MRWITLFGRVGTALLMVGLALTLVSLIPSAPTGFSYGSKRAIRPKKYWVVDSRVYMPQIGLRISVRSNNSVYVYLLGVSRLKFENWTRTWIEEQFPDLDNITVLEAVLQTHSDVILWKSASSKDLSIDFFPSTVLNVTAIIANPSSYWAEIEVEITGITALAPRERVIAPAQWLIPIGIVLAIPWLILSKTKKD